jgi:hypothetical protein
VNGGWHKKTKDLLKQNLPGQGTNHADIDTGSKTAQTVLDIGRDESGFFKWIAALRILLTDRLQIAVQGGTYALNNNLHTVLGWQGIPWHYAQVYPILPGIKSVHCTNPGDQLVGVPTDMLVQITILLVPRIPKDPVIDPVIPRIFGTGSAG